MADGDGDTGRDGDDPEESSDVDPPTHPVDEPTPDDETVPGDDWTFDDEAAPDGDRTPDDDAVPRDEGTPVGDRPEEGRSFDFDVPADDDVTDRIDVPADDNVTDPNSMSSSSQREEEEGTLRSLVRSESDVFVFLREILVSVAIVAVIGALLFSVSGVWPPMVAIESGSMEPNLSRGDLVFVMEEHRFSSDFAVEETGVVPYDRAVERDYRQFGEYGDVIVYQPYGSEDRTPVIHRARFWVDEGENWYNRADPQYINAESCEELMHCPAEQAGFITKGDNAVSNNYYDQARGISSPVKPEWIRGTATVRIPWLGWIRLAVSETTVPVSVGIESTNRLAHSA